MTGVYIGRTLLKERTGVLPKVFYTDEAHYSIQIIRDLLGLEEVLIFGDRQWIATLKSVILNVVCPYFLIKHRPN